MRRVVPVVFVVALAVALLVTFIKLTGPVPIKKILDNPDAYDGKVVTISGEVTGGFDIAGRGSYKVKDQTGSITVITGAGSPQSGKRVKVRGKVDRLARVGKTSVVVIWGEQEK